MADRPARQPLSLLDTGALVRDLRRFARISQTELAHRLATTQPVVSRWERGLDVPRVDTLGRIAHACGFEADLTFRRHDDVDQSQIVGMLDTTPEQRLEQLENVNELLGLAARA